MKKAIKANLIFIWIFIGMIIGFAFTKDINAGIASLKYTMPVGLMVIIIYFIPFNEKVKGTILASIPAIVALIFSVIQGGRVEMFYVYMLSLGMQSLYLNRKLMIGYGSIMALSLMIIYFISPTLLVGSGTQVIEFIMPIGTLMFTFIILVLLSTLEQEKALVADEKTNNTQKALEKLEMMFKEISFLNNSLQDKFNSCNDKIKTGKESIESITSSMEELVTSAGAATTTVTNISSSATTSRENVEQIYEISDYIDQYFKNAIGNINDNQTSALNLKQQLDKIKQVAKNNDETIQKFSKQAESIGSFVDRITDIISQTNLLALDASIVAVRSGEDGEKFASAAEKIRILSEESGDLLKGIRNIIIEFMEPIDVEINEGDDVAESLNEKLDKMKKSFHLAGEKIKNELGVVTAIKNEFNIIDNDIHNITVVFEENDTHFEEVLGRMELQMNIFNEASDIMAEVITIKSNLNKLLKLAEI